MNRPSSLEDFLFQQKPYFCICRIDPDFYNDIFNLYGICKSTGEIKRNLRYIFKKRDYISDSSTLLCLFREEVMCRWWRWANDDRKESIFRIQADPSALRYDRARNEQNSIDSNFRLSIVQTIYAFWIWQLSMLSLSMGSSSSHRPVWRGK